MKVEVGQYKEIDKGSLKASFTLVEYPEGRKTLGCKYFVMGDRKWFQFPSMEIKYTDGRKTEYIPYVSYLNKEYREELNNAVVQALSNIQTQGSNAQGNRNQRQANQLPTQPPADPDDLPF